jgi:hypothetical protein
MRVTLENLTPGMTLAANLQEPGGRLLLPAETTLTDRHLRYLQMWGVADAEVEGEESATGAAASETLDPTLLPAAEERMRGHFRHADLAHPVIEQVFQYCLSREVRRLAGEVATDAT